MIDEREWREKGNPSLAPVWNEFTQAESGGVDAVRKLYRKELKACGKSGEKTAVLAKVMMEKVYVNHQVSEPLADLYSCLWWETEKYACGRLPGNSRNRYYRAFE